MQLITLLLLGAVIGTPLERSPLNLLGQGWQTFQYGPRETEVFSAFNIIHKSAPIILRITDLSAPGAAFKVASNGARILSTPIPALDQSKGPTLNPLRSYNSNAWSSGHAVLAPGFHHVRIFMRYSPWDGGVGAIVAEPADKCEHDDAKDLFVVTNLVDWDSAASVCAGYGAVLADLRRPPGISPSRHARILSKAFKLIRCCQVENDIAWIRGAVDPVFPEEGEFPGSIKAFNDHEGLTGAEWETPAMATLCRKLFD